jgi:hypothetical protein
VDQLPCAQDAATATTTAPAAAAAASLQRVRPQKAGATPWGVCASSPVLPGNRYRRTVNTTCPASPIGQRPGSPKPALQPFVTPDTKHGCIARQHIGACRLKAVLPDPGPASVFMSTLRQHPVSLHEGIACAKRQPLLPPGLACQQTFLTNVASHLPAAHVRYSSPWAMSCCHGVACVLPCTRHCLRAQQPRSVLVCCAARADTSLSCYGSGQRARRVMGPRATAAWRCRGRI